MAEPYVTVRGLGAHVGDRTILHDVHLAAAPGEVVTLLGPSGAGKTTIASAIAASPSPGITLTGHVRVGGARVGYLPQHGPATLNPARRIGAALGELVDLHHTAPSGRRERRAWRRDRIRRVLRKAALDIAEPELGHLLRRYPHQFSGGQRTRLALAQVLATGPDVLVLDEPTTGLDAVSRADLLDGLGELRRTGMTIVLITHDPHVAHALSDRIVEVRDGRTAPADPETVRVPPPAYAPRAARPVRETPAVRLRGVTVTDRHATILRDVDLDLHDGELLGLIGMSGAGKTTLARCVAGLRRPTGGTLLIAGRAWPGLRRRTRAQLAYLQYIPQEAAATFEPRRPVLDQIAGTAIRLRGRTRDDARAEADDLLGHLGIDHHQARRHPAGLSGGQLQRAAIARALLARPKILICDEPTTGLDHPRAAQILDHLDAYRAQTGAAVLTISHQLDAQLHRADRLAVLHAGHITETGPPAHLAVNPGSPALRALLTAHRPGPG